MVYANETPYALFHFSNVRLLHICCILLSTTIAKTSLNVRFMYTVSSTLSKNELHHKNNTETNNIHHFTNASFFFLTIHVHNSRAKNHSSLISHSNVHMYIFSTWELYGRMLFLPRLSCRGINSRWRYASSTNTCFIFVFPMNCAIINILFKSKHTGE
jgi:hypothetical protein